MVAVSEEPSRGQVPPSAALGALFVAEDEQLALSVTAIEAAPGFQTTVWSGISGGLLLVDAHTEWKPSTDLRSEHARYRIGLFDVELGAVGVGDLYHLMIAWENLDEARYGDKQWIAPFPDTPLDALRIFPEFGGSPFSGTDWDWQEGWWYPYSTYAPATAAPRARYRPPDP